MFSNFFPDNRAVYEIMCTSVAIARQATFDNMAEAIRTHGT